APVLEARLLVAPGHALLACPLVASRFAVVGPPADPARVAGAASGVEASLRLADEKGAYALADLPTLAKLAGIGLRVLFAADTTLTNPYTLYVIRTPDARPAARQFAAWAVATARPAIAAIRLPDGSAAFASRGGACAPPTRAPAAPSPAARGRPS